MFILGLECIREGASSFRDHVAPDGRGGDLRSFGLGWIFAELSLSGSPIAGLALGFLHGGVLSATECFSMIMGSRVGASFVVLAVGAFYDVRARHASGGMYVGTIAFITTATVYLPAWGLGYLCLRSGIFADLSPTGGGAVLSFIAVIVGPVVDGLAAALPPWALVLGGIGLLLGAFKLFDAILPPLDPTGGFLGRMATTIFRPSIAFVFGMLVTTITLSVSVSLTLLVPLTVRGVVRRENIIPFVLGANITTFVDTALASIVIRHQDAFVIVLCAAAAVSVISVPIVLFAYRPYERLVDRSASWITRGKRRTIVFVASLFIVPILLIVVGSFA